MSKKTKKCKECGISKNILEFKTNSRTKDGRVSVCQECIAKKANNTRKTQMHDKFYVYRFLDKDDNVIYVGKTVDIHKRIYSHKMKAKSSNITNNEVLMYPSIFKIEYCEVFSDYHMNIYEIHYICKYKPTFNINFKSNNIDLLDLPELNWELYVFNSFLEKVQGNFLMRYMEESINVKEKFEEDIIFRNKLIKVYLDSEHTKLEFLEDIELYMHYYDYDDTNCKSGMTHEELCSHFPEPKQN